MKKNIHCGICGVHIGSLEPGSPVRIGSVYLCADCWRDNEMILPYKKSKTPVDFPDFLRDLIDGRLRKG